MKPLLITFVFVLFFSPMLLHATGELDQLFGNGGKVVSNFGANESANAIVLQTDGKIIAGGSTNASDFILIRFNPIGDADVTFGSNGVVTLDFLGGADILSDLKMQIDGKIVAIGVTQTSDTSSPFLIALARYNPDGTLDPTFGNGGEVKQSLANYSFAQTVHAAIQTDGKIVVVGGAFPTHSGSEDYFAARFNPNGSLDPTFANAGFFTLHIGVSNSFMAFTDVAIQFDDKIVATGNLPGDGGQDPFTDDFVAVRLNPNGSTDATFGSQGVVHTDIAGFNDHGTAVLVQPDGKILAAGLGQVSSATGTDFVLIRYNANGSLDPTFGNGGKVVTDFGNGSLSSDFALGVLLQADGKIIAAGQVSHPGADFGLVRYNPDGSLDPLFAGGKVITDFFGSQDAAHDAVLQPDGKIVAAGFADDPAAHFGLARYIGDIVLPPTCGLFSDDFEDGVLAPDWDYVKPDWNEAGGNLIGTPPHGKAETIATPAFAGCGTGLCTVETTISTAGGPSNKIFFFGWYQDKDNFVEVLMKEEQDKWVIKQIANGVIVAKTKASAVILPNVFYDVKVTFGGTQFTLFVDGVSLVTLNAGATASGTVGYRVKKTTGRFGNICAD